MSALMIPALSYAQDTPPQGYHQGQAWVLPAPSPGVSVDNRPSATPEGPPEPTLQDQAEAAVKNNAPEHRRIVTAVYENDLIGSGEDQYYTSGVRLGYIDIGAEFPSFAYHLADLIPTFTINDTSSIFYSIGQNIYTPQDITQRAQGEDDRPWAGYLYASMGMVTFTDDHTDELELSLGVVGPSAMGEQAQKFIHRHLTDSPMPKGWSNQLKDEPALTLGWQRAWPSFYSADAGFLVTTVSPYVGATVGNVYDFVNGGISVRISPSSEKWQDVPMRVRPAMPGTGFFELPEKRWSWYLFGGLEGRAIARNIFLDGNTFRDSDSVDKEYFVGDANIGAALTYDQMRFSYTFVYRTKEFETQDDNTMFGALSVGYRF